VAGLLSYQVALAFMVRNSRVADFKTLSVVLVTWVERSLRACGLLGLHCQEIFAGGSQQLYRGWQKCKRRKPAGELSRRAEITLSRQLSAKICRTSLRPDTAVAGNPLPKTKTGALDIAESARGDRLPVVQVKPRLWRRLRLRSMRKPSRLRR